MEEPSFGQPGAAAPLTSALTGLLGRTVAVADARRDPAAFRKLCPKRPGVYLMTDAAGTILYVGKSGCLRARLATYLRATDLDEKAARIMTAAERVSWEPMPDELASRLREIELIQALGPRYNVQFNPARKRRGYLCLTTGVAPGLFVSTERPRRAEFLEAVGPLPSRRMLERAAEVLNELFHLRNCPATVQMAFADDPPDRRAGGRRAGCIRHEVKTCLGPCVRGSTSARYDAQVALARSFIKGRDLTPLHAVRTKMDLAADALAFEEAAALRDRWRLLRWLSRRMRELRRARRGFDFVYPLASVDGGETWYVVRGGQVAAAFPRPTSAAEVAAAHATIASVFAVKRRSAWPDSLGGENLGLVTRWFRENPQDLARVIPPEAALAMLDSAGYSPPRGQDPA